MTEIVLPSGDGCKVFRNNFLPPLIAERRVSKYARNYWYRSIDFKMKSYIYLLIILASPNHVPRTRTYFERTGHTLCKGTGVIRTYFQNKLKFKKNTQQHNYLLLFYIFRRRRSSFQLRVSRCRHFSNVHLSRRLWREIYIIYKLFR